MHVLALDAGTTGITALILDASRRIVGRAYQEFDQHFPQPGWVEHDALQITHVAQDVMAKALRNADLQATDIAAVGITNQRETTVIWDRKSGVPIHRAIVWQDRRTADACEALQPEWQERIRARTGLVLDAYFCASKIQWLLQNVDGAQSRADVGELAFGTIDTWLAWCLTGQHVTDPTNASRTLIWDIHKGEWDPELMDLFGVPASILPEVVPSSHIIGKITNGSLEGVPVAALVGDQQAALFGQRCFVAGQAKNTYGTGCFLLQHTGSTAIASQHGLLTTRAASLDEMPQFALEGSVFVGGAAIQWLRDGLKMIDEAPEVNDEAAKSDDSGGVVVVPAFAGLGAPHWDPNARGAVLGLTRGTSRRHIARATLESIAYQSADVIAAMEADSGHQLPELRVDGGATQSAVLMQCQSNLLNRPVVRPSDVESTALGAAYLAGIAVGAWTLEDLEATPPGATVFEPDANASTMDAGRVRWNKAIQAVRAFGSPARGD